MVGDVLGSYRILRQIGRGGFGEVYAAEHQLLGRRAAIKVLLARYSEDETIVERFFNEARATARIRHPGIVQVYDFGFHEGQAYLAMELLEGESLAQRLDRQGVLPEPLAVAVARDIAGVLGAAHDSGIIHRDLKPENVFLSPDAKSNFGVRVKLLDFGVAKLGEVTRLSSTQSGAILGTPLYMSPEQCRSAGRVDQRSDIYSLGCLLYEMLAGKPPFQETGLGDVLLAHMQREPPPLRPRVSPAVEALVMRALAKSPGDRPQSCAAFIDELDHASETDTLRSGASPVSQVTTRRADPAAARRWLWPAVAAVVAGGAAGTVFLSVRPRPRPPAAAAPAPAAIVVEKPRLVRVAISSRPPGAAVLDESGQVVGETPFLGELPERPGARRFVLHLSGFQDGEVIFAGDRDGDKEVALAPTPPPAEPRRVHAPRRPGETVREDGTVDPFAEPPRRR